MSVQGAAISGGPTAVTAPTSEQPPAESRSSKTLLAGFAGAHFSHHVSNSLLNPLLPPIRDSFGLGYSEAGLLVSAFSWSIGLSNAPVGFLADRVGALRVVVGGLILTGLLGAALAFSGAYWQLLALVVILGVVAASYHAPAASMIAAAFPPSVRGSAMGLHVTGGNLSFFATPLIAGSLLAAGGTWQTPFLWFAWAPILAGLVIWFVAPARLRGGGSNASGAGRFAVFREVWGVARLVGPLVSTSIVFQMVYAAFVAFVTLYLVDVKGVSVPLAAALFGVPQLIGVFAAPLAGYLSDRWGRRSVMVLGMALLGPSLYSLTLVPAELVLIPLAITGVASSMRQTVTEVLVMDSAPEHRRATVLGSYYMLSQELGGFAAPILGFTAGIIGLSSAFTGVTLLLVALSALVVVGHRRL